MKKLGFLFAIAFGLTGCTSLSSLNDRVGTMKNPRETLRNPGNTKSSSNSPFVIANYNVLLSAIGGADKDQSLLTDKVEAQEMSVFLDSGFALSDIYCRDFFRDAEESQRTRKYGRAITNDAGTAISTILGLANAGQDIVTGTAATFGLLDSTWRNYDEAFVVSPDLSSVKALVISAQNVFKQETSKNLPQNYAAAQSVIMRYADQCSTLGMQSLLTLSANETRRALDDKTDEGGETGAGAADGAGKPAVAPPPAPQPSPVEARSDAAPVAIPQLVVPGG